MMKRWIMALVALGWVFSAEAYPSLEALLEDMAQKEFEALKNYIEANPEAEDAGEARQMLVYRLMAEQSYDEALQHLEVMYAKLPEDKSQVALDVAGELIFATIQTYQSAGKTNELFAFIDKVRSDFKNHEEAGMIEDSLDEFVQMISADRPGLGEEIDLSFTAIDGREISASAMTGQVVLVDFWATWCGPCIRAMPALKALYRDYHDKGFEIIGISLDNERADLDAYLEREDITWPHYFDGKGWENDLAAEFGIDSIPATFLIGPDGRIAAINAGEDELRTMIQKLLERPVTGP